MGWLYIAGLLLTLCTLMTHEYPAPQGAQHGAPQAGIPQSTPSPFPTGGVGGVRRTLSGWREWRRADPTLINSLWRSKMGNGIRKQLGNAEVYIMLALLIGLATVVIGCWLSDNCWSPEPDSQIITVA
uniref:Uncharacterized protein LOC114330534 n=1 Tax=Diabrotica virgifera virgifera TaxID=50390 RepID=A0A6P7FSB4_DIAVI